jgi:hypothetical protein
MPDAEKVTLPVRVMSDGEVLEVQHHVGGVGHRFPLQVQPAHRGGHVCADVIELRAVRHRKSGALAVAAGDELCNFQALNAVFVSRLLSWNDLCNRQCNSIEYHHAVVFTLPEDPLPGH